MKRWTIYVISALLLTATFAVARAQEVVDSPDDAVISQHCKSTQIYLDQSLKERDIRTRVDRLQAYNYIYQRFDAFTTRLERNNQTGSKTMRAELDTLHAAIGSFKAAYESYDVARDQLAQMDNCHARPGEFRQQLAEVRAKRQVVATTLAAVQTSLSPQIDSQLTSLQRSFEPATVPEGTQP